MYKQSGYTDQISPRQAPVIRRRTVKTEREVSSVPMPHAGKRQIAIPIRNTSVTPFLLMVYVISNTRSFTGENRDQC